MCVYLCVYYSCQKLILFKLPASLESNGSWFSSLGLLCVLHLVLPG